MTKINIIQQIFNIMPNGLAGFSIGIIFLLLITLLGELIKYVGDQLQLGIIQFLLSILLLIVIGYNFFKLTNIIQRWK